MFTDIVDQDLHDYYTDLEKPGLSDCEIENIANDKVEKDFETKETSIDWVLGYIDENWDKLQNSKISEIIEKSKDIAFKHYCDKQRGE